MTDVRWQNDVKTNVTGLHHKRIFLILIDANAWQWKMQNTLSGNRIPLSLLRLLGPEHGLCGLVDQLRP